MGIRRPKVLGKIALGDRTGILWVSKKAYSKFEFDEKGCLAGKGKNGYSCLFF